MTKITSSSTRRWGEGNGEQSNKAKEIHRKVRIKGIKLGVCEFSGRRREKEGEISGNIQKRVSLPSKPTVSEHEEGTRQGQGLVSEVGIHGHHGLEDMGTYPSMPSRMQQEDVREGTGTTLTVMDTFRYKYKGIAPLHPPRKVQLSASHFDVYPYFPSVQPETGLANGRKLSRPSC